VVTLQFRRKKIYHVIFLIFLITSCVFFDDTKADGLMCLSDAIKDTIPNVTASYNISTEDTCTVEMLGDTYTCLLNQQTVTYHSETQRKTETLFGGLEDYASLQLSFRFFASTNPDIYADNTDVAELMHFIHNKDGKKKL
jgi:hypothetical protein